MIVFVRGGSNAGWKRPKLVNKVNWICAGCGKELRYYWTKCPNCGSPHPER